MKSHRRPKVAPLVIAFSWIVFPTSESQAQFEFGTPTKLPDAVNSTALDFEPSISSDGLELYFTSSRRWGTWVARWDPVEGYFEPAEFAASFNHPSISHDGLTLYGNTSGSGQFGGADLYFVTRPNRDEPWESRLTNLGPNVNGEDWERGPAISADGRELYFTRSATADSGYFDLYVATRNDV